VIQFISRTGEGFFPNQSVNGILNRLLFNGNNLQWERHAFAPFHPTFIGHAIKFRPIDTLPTHRSREKKLAGGVIDFMIIALSCTIASPIAWEHHYGILLVIFAVLLPYVLSHPVWGRSTLLLFILSYVLASNFLGGIFNNVASVPILNVMQSYLFIAGVTVLVFLYRVEDGKHVNPPSHTQPTCCAPVKCRQVL
jgi:hypothetical protein